MTDQSNIQEQSAQKREHATIHEEGYVEVIDLTQLIQSLTGQEVVGMPTAEITYPVRKVEPGTEMSNEPAQAEEEQGVAYLDIRRNWHTRMRKMDEWILDIHGYPAKVFFLKDGRIGMEYGGRVIVRSIELWMSLEQDA